MEAAPENRAMTVAVIKRLGLFPLDAKHRDHPQCMCSHCFTEEPQDTLPVQELDELRRLARRRSSAKVLPWENAA